MGKLGGFRGPAVDVGLLDDRTLIADLVEITHIENAFAAARLVSLAEIDRRGLARTKLGAATTRSWWARSANITDGRAGSDLDLGLWLGAHPAVLKAMTDGPLDRDHAAAVRDGLAIVATADPELDLEPVEAELLELAFRDKPSAVTRRAEAIALPAQQARRAREQKKYEDEMAERRRREEEEAKRRAQKADNPDSTPNPDPTPNPEPKPDPTPGPTPPAPAVPPAEDTTLNRFTLFRLPNGRYEGKVNVDKLTAETMLSQVHSLAKPQPGLDGEPDDRSPARRNADALSTLFGRGFGTGVVTTLLVVSLADLTGHKGSACSDAPGQWPYDLSWTGPVSEELATLITCDGDLVPIIVDDAGVPLAEGRRVRLATDEQRWAVYVRDRCCIGCGKDKHFCEIHHMKHWRDGGSTDLRNCALLCTDCHRRLVHHGGWEVILGDDCHPWMIPPASVDPERRPIPSFHRRT